MSRFSRHVVELLRQGLCFDEGRVVKNCFPQGEYFSNCPRLEPPFITLPTNFRRNHLARSFSFFALTFPSLCRYDPVRVVYTVSIEPPQSHKHEFFFQNPSASYRPPFSTAESILPLVPAQTIADTFFEFLFGTFGRTRRSLFLAIYFISSFYDTRRRTNPSK